MEAVSSLELVVYGVVVLFAAILSGISGAGAGFVTTPLLIFLGLPPAQAVATGKLSGLSLSLGSIGGLKGVKRKSSSRRMGFILIAALMIGLAAPYIIARLDSELYKNVLGVLILFMIPMIIIKKVGQQEYSPGPTKKVIGAVLLVVSLSLQAVFSGGLGTLVNLVMMGFLGMPALEANITKRYSQVVLNGVIVIGVLIAGLVVWRIALIGIVSAGLGGFVGGKMAAKRGNKFIMAITIGLMFISAIGLLLS